MIQQKKRFNKREGIREYRKGRAALAATIKRWPRKARSRSYGQERTTPLCVMRRMAETLPEIHPAQKDHEDQGLKKSNIRGAEHASRSMVPAWN